MNRPMMSFLSLEMSRPGAHRFATISGMAKPLVAPGILANDETSKSLATSPASRVAWLVSMTSATAWPFEAMSWAMADSKVELTWLIYLDTSRSFRSMSWAEMR